jgi:hypothetical protein
MEALKIGVLPNQAPKEFKSEAFTASTQVITNKKLSSLTTPDTPPFDVGG